MHPRQPISPPARARSAWAKNPAPRSWRRALKYDAAHIAGTKFLGQISSTPVGFVTAKGSPVAKALSDAVNELITNGDYAKIFSKWGVAGTDEITRSTLNPAPTF